MNTEMIQRMYDVLDDLTPMTTDCGALCNAACCGVDEDGQGGVYLFPGEEAFAEKMIWGRIEHTDFAPMLVCGGMCDRGYRPFACRIFPLTPVKNVEGKWTVRMDARSRAMCPLARSGVRGLNPDFARAVVKAVRMMAKEPEGEAFLEKWGALEEEYRFEL